MWNRFGEQIKATADRRKVRLADVERELGVSHARLHNAANGQPVGTEIYLAICKWMNAHPAKFWSGDLRHEQAP